MCHFFSWRDGLVERRRQCNVDREVMRKFNDFATNGVLYLEDFSRLLEFYECCPTQALTGRTARSPRRYRRRRIAPCLVGHDGTAEMTRPTSTEEQQNRNRFIHTTEGKSK